jgi:putative addiction module component (TIGR02574 family)
VEDNVEKEAQSREQADEACGEDPVEGEVGHSGRDDRGGKREREFKRLCGEGRRWELNHGWIRMGEGILTQRRRGAEERKPEGNSWVVSPRLDKKRQRAIVAIMSSSLDALSEEALVLPPDQRLLPARRLLDSVDLEPVPGAEAAWEVEIARRIAGFDAGESQPIPAAEVFERLREFAPDRSL